MEILERLKDAGVVPVVVLDDAKDAVPTAKAMLEGGIDVMEITFRTEAAAESIKAVSEGCPEMLVGAGTVLNLEQCKEAISLGAKFIVSPGFDEEIAKFCLDSNVPVAPGCVTPTEIMEALKLGLSVLKFFPASVYGGINALKALSAPFASVSFIPTGGVNAANLAEFIRAPFVHAVGGSWVCAKEDISAGNFEKITSLCKEARHTLLGFEAIFYGVGDESLIGKLAETLGSPVRIAENLTLSSQAAKLIHSNGLAKQSCIVVLANSAGIALSHLARCSIGVDEESVVRKGGKASLARLKEDISSLPVYLVQK